MFRLSNLQITREIYTFNKNIFIKKVFYRMKKCFTCNKIKELSDFKSYKFTNSCGFSKNCLTCTKQKIAHTKGETANKNMEAIKEAKLAKLYQDYLEAKTKLEKM